MLKIICITSYMLLKIELLVKGKCQLVSGTIVVAPLNIKAKKPNKMLATIKCLSATTSAAVIGHVTL